MAILGTVAILFFVAGDAVLPSRLLWPCLFACVVFCARDLWIALGSVTVDSVGITSKRPARKPRRLRWIDIRRMHERTTRGVLELHGDSGQPVQVFYMLNDFPTLRDIIYYNTHVLMANAADASRTSLPMTFKQDGTDQTVWFCVGMLCLIGGAYFIVNPLKGQTAYVFFALAAGCWLCAWALYQLLWPLNALTVDHDRVILHGMIRRLDIPFAEIANVVLTETPVAIKGIVIAVRVSLVLILKNGKQLDAGTFKDQTHFARDLIDVTRS